MSARTELEFLPAALEILERPPSPAGRTVLWTIVLLFVLAVAWSCWGVVDIVTVAHGRIIPSGHVKTLQPVEAGRISSMNVRDGDEVRAGDILVALDPSGVRADINRLAVELDNALGEVRRLQRLNEWIRRDAGPEAQEGGPIDPLLRQRWHEYEDRIAVLDRERDARRAEHRSARRRVAKLEAILPIVTDKAGKLGRLAEQKLLPEEQFLQSEQERLATYHDLQTERGQVEELDADIAALEGRMRLMRSETGRDLLERLEQARLRASTVRQELAKAEARALGLELRAPVDGVVQQVAVHHVGAVVTPAQPVLVVVPKGEALEVEAIVENKDIGFVRAGQPTEVKVDTFPFTRYGSIRGEVVDVSHDAVPDEARGLVYRMRVRLDRQDLEVDGRPVPLAPGMTVAVEARTGTRRLIEYLLSPLLRYRDEAARER